MRYHQLSEVFVHLVTLNIATLAFYERSLEVTKKERGRIFLNYLIGKQKVRNEHLMTSLRDGPIKIYEMWFDDEIDLKLLAFIDTLALEPDISSDKMSMILIEVNEKIEVWLKSISPLILNSDAKEYLEDLINYLHKENQQIMYSVQRMDEM
tara:strand:- start:211 stop:666 length:456 start_codon:yes stop_codon:yes gene_type:complete